MQRGDGLVVTRVRTFQMTCYCLCVCAVIAFGNWETAFCPGRGFLRRGSLGGGAGRTCCGQRNLECQLGVKPERAD